MWLLQCPGIWGQQFRLVIDSQAGSSYLNASNGVDGHFKEIPVAVGESSLGVNFFVLILFEI